MVEACRTPAVKTGRLTRFHIQRITGESEYYGRRQLLNWRSEWNTTRVSPSKVQKQKMPLHLNPERSMSSVKQPAFILRRAIFNKFHFR
jgi:hypothetical protein